MVTGVGRANRPRVDGRRALGFYQSRFSCISFDLLLPGRTVAILTRVTKSHQKSVLLRGDAQAHATNPLRTRGPLCVA